MICNSCNLKEVSSPNLTGLLCTGCFFKSKQIQSSQSVNDAPASEIKTEPALLERIVDTPQLIDTSIESEEPESNKVIPIKQNQVKDPTKKYCQSCIERGYGLTLATREWNPNEFLCDDCFSFLLNNITGISENEIRETQKILPTLDSTKPLLNQFYDIFNVPDALRYQKPDLILKHREEIFNHHAVSIVNLEQSELAQMIEQYQSVLFYIKESLSSFQNEINRIKAVERENNQLSSVSESTATVRKAGTSKAKQSSDQKMADTLFKLSMPGSTPQQRLEKYLKFNADTKEAEFKKRISQ